MNNHPTLATLALKRARLHALSTTRTVRCQSVRHQFAPLQFARSQYRSRQQIGLQDAFPRIATYLVLTLALIGTLLPASVSASSNASPDISLNARAVVDSINQIRASHGQPYLALNPQLVQAAQNHVIDMVTHSHHSHTGTDGSSVRTRVARTGYSSGSMAGENWVALTDPTKAVEWWMASPPHRGNILNTTWKEIGIGAGVNTNSGLNYFVVVFAARDNGSVAPAPVANSVNNPQSLPVQPPIAEQLPEFHHVQSGETLSSIAAKYGLSWQSLASANNLGEFSILAIGQSIRLRSSGAPASGNGAAAVRDLPYTVVAGDTLFTLGGRFNVPWQNIAQRNGLSENSVLSIEQVIQIPVAATLVNEAILEDRTFAPPVITPTHHVVQDGETIIVIALQYDLNWKELLNVNALTDSTLLAVGQTIRLK